MSPTTESPDFDVVGALRNDAYNLPAVLDVLQATGCRRLLLSGSAFEGGEGAAPKDYRTFLRTVLSKALTSRLFAYYCDRAGVGLGKFVIPNPFGPL